MKEQKYFNNRGFMSKNLITLLDMLTANDGAHSNGITELRAELAYQRRLQGIYNVLFGVTVGVLMVVAIRGL